MALPHVNIRVKSYLNDDTVNLEKEFPRTTTMGELKHMIASQLMIANEKLFHRWFLLMNGGRNSEQILWEIIFSSTPAATAPPSHQNSSHVSVMNMHFHDESWPANKRFTCNPTDTLETLGLGHTGDDIQIWLYNTMSTTDTMVFTTLAIQQQTGQRLASTEQYLGEYIKSNLEASILEESSKVAARVTEVDTKVTKVVSAISSLKEDVKELPAILNSETLKLIASIGTLTEQVTTLSDAQGELRRTLQEQQTAHSIMRHESSEMMKETRKANLQHTKDMDLIKDMLAKLLNSSTRETVHEMSNRFCEEYNAIQRSLSETLTKAIKTLTCAYVVSPFKAEDAEILLKTDQIKSRIPRQSFDTDSKEFVTILRAVSNGHSHFTPFLFPFIKVTAGYKCLIEWTFIVKNPSSSAKTGVSAGFVRSDGKSSGVALEANYHNVEEWYGNHSNVYMFQHETCDIYSGGVKVFHLHEGIYENNPLTTVQRHQEAGRRKYALLLDMSKPAIALPPKLSIFWSHDGTDYGMRRQEGRISNGNDNDSEKDYSQSSLNVPKNLSLIPCFSLYNAGDAVVVNRILLVSDQEEEDEEAIKPLPAYCYL